MRGRGKQEGEGNKRDRMIDKQDRKCVCEGESGDTVDSPEYGYDRHAQTRG